MNRRQVQEGQLSEQAKRFLPGAEVKLQALSAPRDQVLARCKVFFDRTVELASTGLKDDQLGMKLYEEFPDFLSYNGLLRMTLWGYSLVHDVIAAQLQKNQIILNRRHYDDTWRYL